MAAAGCGAAHAEHRLVVHAALTEGFVVVEHLPAEDEPHPLRRDRQVARRRHRERELLDRHAAPRLDRALGAVAVGDEHPDAVGRPPAAERQARHLLRAARRGRRRGARLPARPRRVAPTTDSVSSASALGRVGGLGRAWAGGSRWRSGWAVGLDHLATQAAKQHPATSPSNRPRFAGAHGTTAAHVTRHERQQQSGKPTDPTLHSTSRSNASHSPRPRAARRRVRGRPRREEPRVPGWRRSDPRWATPKPVFEACRSHYVLVDVVQRPMRAPRIISAVSAMPGHEFTIGEPTPAGGSYVCYATKPPRVPRRSGSPPRVRARGRSCASTCGARTSSARAPRTAPSGPRRSCPRARAGARLAAEQGGAEETLVGPELRRDLRARRARSPFQPTCAF